MRNVRVALPLMACWLVSLSACCNCAPPSGPVTFAFTGEITNVSDAFGVLGGLSAPIPYSGWYSFDPSAADTNADPDNGRYVSTIGGSGMVVSFDAFSLGTPPVGPVLTITTSDEPPNNAADIYSVRSGSVPGTEGFPPGWRFQVLIDVAKGSPSDLLTSPDLPTTPPDLSIPGVNVTFQIVGGPTPSNIGSLNLVGTLLTLTPR